MSLIRDRRRPQGAAQRPCGYMCAGAGRARRAGLGQRAGHGGRVGSHRADPAGAEVETAFSVEGTSVASRPVRVLTDDEGRERLASAPAPSSTLHTLFDLPEF